MSPQKQQSDIPYLSPSATGNQVQSTIDDLVGSNSVKKCLQSCVEIEKDKSHGMICGGLEHAYLENHLGCFLANNMLQKSIEKWVNKHNECIDKLKSFVIT